MAEHKKEKPDQEKLGSLQQEAPEQERPKRESRHLFRRFVVLVLAVLVVLGAVAVTLLEDGAYLNRVRRWLAYGSSEESNSYAFAADPNNRYGQLGERLIVLSQNHLQVLESDSRAYFSKEVQLNKPALDVGNTMAVAYDIGGSNLYVFSAEGLVLELNMEEGCGIIAARMNDDDHLAVVSEQSGYKGVVTVYDAGMEKVFAYRSSSEFLTDAVVSANGKAVTVVALGETEGGFATHLLRYDLTRTVPEAEAFLPGHLTLDTEELDGRMASVSDGEIIFTDADGAVTGNFTYGGLYLRDYALSGGDFAALLLNRYRSGSIGTLVSVDGDGKAIAMLDITDEVMDIAAAGNFIAVLYGDSLVVYDRSLQQQSTLEGTNYASHVLLSADGAATVIGGNTAWRYLP